MSTALAYRPRPACGAVDDAAGARLSLVSEAPGSYRAGDHDTADAGQPPARNAGGPAQPETHDPVDPHEALAALQHAAEVLARADLGALSDRELLEFTVAVDQQGTRIQAHRARALAEVDQRQAYRHDACVTTASWWRMRTRRDHREASRQVRAAQRLRWLGVTRAAFEAGQITAGHVDVIARAAIPRRRDAIVDHEDALVSLAQAAHPHDVAIACRHIAELVDPDATDATHPRGEPGASDERRQAYLSRTIDGLWNLRAILDPVTGERLDTLMRTLAKPDPAATPELDRRTGAQHRHDALDQILRAAEEHPDLPTAHGATPHVLLTIDLFTVLGRDDLASRRPRLGSGSPSTSTGRSTC